MHASYLSLSRFKSTAYLTKSVAQREMKVSHLWLYGGCCCRHVECLPMSMGSLSFHKPFIVLVLLLRCPPFTGRAAIAIAIVVGGQLRSRFVNERKLSSQEECVSVGGCLSVCFAVTLNASLCQWAH